MIMPYPLMKDLQKMERIIIRKKIRLILVIEKVDMIRNHHRPECYKNLNFLIIWHLKKNRKYRG